ncbi:L-serine ammonia-lyase, iron-sulfur-dependent, subunit alpha [Intestinimonas butyriciproducens]|uniref:L-serine ammonia-lyase, iron-sulfur-dependent, subunit alpha n=1 Tax=Intestinimonas butyriciproducens TaxID=1297617 RepID=UPI00189A0D93|nr:L-serine ammonia-lyase, iron-sulfur-dependent, subunit alpha [Intestinimonas butyriciproducens]MDB7830552.1 L-serine ammonia-lyase, iron-sulfur-dependent, subunit alpha [Intestinimonas butyriciproducens]
MAFVSVESLLRAAGDMPLWEAVLTDDLRDRGGERDASWEKMTRLWRAMVESVEGYDPARRSACNLTGGDARKVETCAVSLAGPVLTEIIATALKVGECNACMGRIVAAPTAGASGVLPAVLLPIRKKYDFSEEKMVKALYISAGFGQVIATRASIAGAEGGCQAEIGSASAMAAAALVSLLGGTPEQMAAACATALQNLLGLVCDPVAGLVEVPCVKRNVIGAVNALTAAELALAGVENVIPCDEVIDAMRAVGDVMPTALRETGGGGLAATPTGRRIAEELLGP